MKYVKTLKENLQLLKESTPVVKVGSKIRVKNGATSWEAEVVKVNADGTPAVLKSIRDKSPDFGKEYKGSWDEYEVIEESVKVITEDISDQEFKSYVQALNSLSGACYHLEGELNKITNNEVSYTNKNISSSSVKRLLDKIESTKSQIQRVEQVLKKWN